MIPAVAQLEASAGATCRRQSGGATCPRLCCRAEGEIALYEQRRAKRLKLLLGFRQQQQEQQQLQQQQQLLQQQLQLQLQQQQLLTDDGQKRAVGRCSNPGRVAQDGATYVNNPTRPLVNVVSRCRVSPLDIGHHQSDMLGPGDHGMAAKGTTGVATTAAAATSAAGAPAAVEEAGPIAHVEGPLAHLESPRVFALHGDSSRLLLRCDSPPAPEPVHLHSVHGVTPVSHGPYYNGTSIVGHTYVAHETLLACTVARPAAQADMHALPTFRRAALGPALLGSRHFSGTHPLQETEAAAEGRQPAPEPNDCESFLSLPHNNLIHHHHNHHHHQQQQHGVAAHGFEPVLALVGKHREVSGGSQGQCPGLDLNMRLGPPPAAAAALLNPNLGCSRAAETEGKGEHAGDSPFLTAPQHGGREEPQEQPFLHHQGGQETVGGCGRCTPAELGLQRQDQLQVQQEKQQGELLLPQHLILPQENTMQQLQEQQQQHQHHQQQQHARTLCRTAGANARSTATWQQQMKSEGAGLEDSDQYEVESPGGNEAGSTGKGVSLASKNAEKDDPMTGKGGPSFSARLERKRGRNEDCVAPRLGSQAPLKCSGSGEGRDAFPRVSAAGRLSRFVVGTGPNPLIGSDQLGLRRHGGFFQSGHLLRAALQAPRLGARCGNASALGAFGALGSRSLGIVGPPAFPDGGCLWLPPKDAAPMCGVAGFGERCGTSGGAASFGAAHSVQAECSGASCGNNV